MDLTEMGAAGNDGLGWREIEAGPVDDRSAEAGDLQRLHMTLVLPQYRAY